MRTYLNDGWQFFENWSDDIFGGDVGQNVRIPHANVTTPFNNFDESVYQFVSGYKRVLHLDDVDGRTFLLTFDGVAHYAEVYVNGKCVATHASGYTAFTVDVTDAVRQGDNQIVVKVDSRETLNQPPFGYVIDYLTYGGIYRDVYLDERKGVYVKDVFVKSVPDSPVIADVILADFCGECQLLAKISDAAGETVFSCCYTANTDKLTLSLPCNLKTWDITDPNLYTLTITAGNEEYAVTFGARKAEFTKDGFYLNGKKIKIVGLNRHQSYPYVGYAMP